MITVLPEVTSGCEVYVLAIKQPESAKEPDSRTLVANDICTKHINTDSKVTFLDDDEWLEFIVILFL